MRLHCGCGGLRIGFIVSFDVALAVHLPLVARGTVAYAGDRRACCTGAATSGQGRRAARAAAAPVARPGHRIGRGSRGTGRRGGIRAWAVGVGFCGRGTHHNEHQQTDQDASGKPRRGSRRRLPRRHRGWGSSTRRVIDDPWQSRSPLDETRLRGPESPHNQPGAGCAARHAGARLEGPVGRAGCSDQPATHIDRRAALCVPAVLATAQIADGTGPAAPAKANGLGIRITSPFSVESGAAPRGVFSCKT